MPPHRLVSLGPRSKHVSQHLECFSPASTSPSVWRSVLLGLAAFSLSECLFGSASAFTSFSVLRSVLALPLLACEQVLLLASLPLYRAVCRQVAGPSSLIVLQPACPPCVYKCTSPSVTKASRRISAFASAKVFSTSFVFKSVSACV